MATISRMAINLAWEGQEAEAGLAKTSNLLKQTGIAALDASDGIVLAQIVEAGAAFRATVLGAPFSLDHE